MPHLMLGWRIAAVGAVGLALAAGLIVLIKPQGHRGHTSVAILRESGIVLGLFAFWQLAGTMAHHSAAGAVGRGARILDIEAALHISTERAIEGLIAGHPLLTQLCNGFYLYGHFNGMILFLGWIFIWHREHYPAVRMSVVLLTATSFFLHLITVAPPRLLPGAGFVDTAAEYGQSVYGPTTLGVADQLSAFPSVHIGWAAIVAYWAWRVSPSRWGWVGVAHFVLTSFVVVATANHYLLDGLGAVGILGAALLLQRWVPAAVRAARAGHIRAAAEPQSGLVSAGS